MESKAFTISLVVGLAIIFIVGLAAYSHGAAKEAGKQEGFKQGFAQGMEASVDSLLEIHGPEPDTVRIRVGVPKWLNSQDLKVRQLIAEHVIQCGRETNHRSTCLEEAHTIFDP